MPTNPDYATLLGQIGAKFTEIENLTKIIDDLTEEIDDFQEIIDDPASTPAEVTQAQQNIVALEATRTYQEGLRTTANGEKLDLEDDCYQFVEELDRNEIELFEYGAFLTVEPNPGDDGDSYIGDYVGAPAITEEEYLQPVFAIALNKNAVDEGSTFTATLSVTNRPGDITSPITRNYEISGITANDIAEDLTGSFIIPANATVSQTKTFNVSTDTLTEGEETLTISLADSEVSAQIIINDTSLSPVPPDPDPDPGPQSPVYVISGRVNGMSPVMNQIAEGQVFDITLTCLNRDFIPGDIIEYYTVSDSTISPTPAISISPDDLDPAYSGMDGFFRIPEGQQSATIQFQCIIDTLFEGPEVFTIALNDYPDVARSYTIIDSQGNETDSGSAPTYPTSTGAVLFDSEGLPLTDSQGDQITSEDLDLSVDDINTKLASIN